MSCSIMAKRKPFLLRLPEELLDALNVWAKDDLRSLNAQIEYLLRDQMQRWRRSVRPPPNPDPTKQDRSGGNDYET